MQFEEPDDKLCFNINHQKGSWKEGRGRFGTIWVIIVIKWFIGYNFQIMSHFLKQNICSPKHTTENRVLMLAQKINTLKIGHKANAERKMDTLEKQVMDLEGEFERSSISFNDQNYELKHLFSKIGKELSVDHAETDLAIREQTQKCQQMALEMISVHIDQRKASDARITRFVDDKCAIIRDLIDRENKERSINIKDIEDSLDKDLSDIREKLDRDNGLREQQIDNIHAQFLQEYETIRSEFAELSEKYGESQAEFYKMLRDVLKKVKKEIGQGRQEREEMEESILVLIERICDKAMENDQ